MFPAISTPVSTEYNATAVVSQEVSPVDRFILKFEIWLFGRFSRSLNSGVSGAPDATDLISALRPWIFGHNPPAEAVKLEYLLPEPTDSGADAPPHGPGNCMIAQVQGAEPDCDALLVGNIAVAKRVGSPSWDLTLTLATKKVEISTRDLDWACDFMQQLLTIVANRSQSWTSPAD